MPRSTLSVHTPEIANNDKMKSRADSDAKASTEAAATSDLVPKPKAGLFNFLSHRPGPLTHLTRRQPKASPAMGRPTPEEMMEACRDGQELTKVKHDEETPWWYNEVLEWDMFNDDPAVQSDMSKEIVIEKHVLQSLLHANLAEPKGVAKESKAAHGVRKVLEYRGDVWHDHTGADCCGDDYWDDFYNGYEDYAMENKDEPEPLYVPAAARL
ncbi:hypothetical protein H0H93_013156 [Arthromyces matolae]|nr:hypothetical protein H0H93_013156 [Arthromyces matolae]